MFQRHELFLFEIDFVEPDRLRRDFSGFHFRAGNPHLDARKLCRILKRHRRQNFHDGSRERHVAKDFERIIVHLGGPNRHILALFHGICRERDRQIAEQRPNGTFLLRLDIRTDIKIVIAVIEVPAFSPRKQELRISLETVHVEPGEPLETRTLRDRIHDGIIHAAFQIGQTILLARFEVRRKFHQFLRTRDPNVLRRLEANDPILSVPFPGDGKM